MKMYITGSVGSGKSTLARDISKITGIPCYHLDEIVHVEDKASLWGNRKRSTHERDELFYNIILKSKYIIEDSGRECFIKGMHESDVIIILEIPLFIIRKRIFLRWIKQNLGIEKCIYKPNFNMLIAMFKWAKNYNTGADGVKRRIMINQNKTVFIHSNKDIKKFLFSLSQNNNL